MSVHVPETFKVEFDPTRTVGTRHLGNGEYAEMTLEEAVIERAAQILVAKVDRDAVKRIQREFEERVGAIVDETMRPAIAAIMEEDVEVSDDWGGRQFRGSLRDLVLKYAREQLAVATDRYGHAKTTLSKVLQAEVDTVLTRELTDEVKRAKAQVTQTLRESAASVIAKTITDGLRS